MKPSSSNSRTPRNGDDSRDGLTRKQQKQLHVGSADGANSTDTIMIAHVPADGSNATLISIPRDSWVQIPGYGMGKINAAYGDGYRDAPGTHPSTKDRQKAGADELIATVTRLTGLGINHYVQVGFGGFYTIAKAIGGIDVTLCEAVDDTAARNRAEGQIAGSGFDMSAGRHHLNPIQALEFVPQRHNLPGPNGNDIGREKRQQYFLAQAFEQIASGGELLNPIRLHNLINTITGAFFIDGNFSLQDFADQMLDLNAQHIVGHTIPIVNVNGHIGDLNVVLVDPHTVKAKGRSDDRQHLRSTRPIPGHRRAQDRATDLAGPHTIRIAQVPRVCLLTVSIDRDPGRPAGRHGAGERPAACPVTPLRG